MMQDQEDYVGDFNIKRLAYIGMNAVNYLLARKMLHSVSKEINVDDPIESILNADKLAATIQYNKEPGASLKFKKEDNHGGRDNYLLMNL